MAKIQLTQCPKEEVYRSPDGNGDFLVPNSKYPKTIFEAFEAGWKRTPDAPLFGHREDGVGPYIWSSYDAIRTRALNFGNGIEQLRITHLGVDNNQYPIGIYSINRPEWCIVDIANCFRSSYTVALYDTYGRDSLCYVIEHAELQIVVTSSLRIPTLLEEKCKLPNLKIIISMDYLEPNSELTQRAISLDVVLMTMVQVEALGSENPLPHKEPDPEDIYTICYTSGTTGKPKGAIMTHWNFASSLSIGSVQMKLNDLQTKVYASYLPLAHTMERLMMVNLYYASFAIGFYRGSIPDLMEDIAEIQPGIFMAVPRILNRLYDRINTVANGSGVGPLIFRFALAQKESIYHEGGSAEHWLWDRLVFQKVRNVLGGRVESILTGSAPISKEVLDFLRVVLCPNIHEGYGLTETAAAGCVSMIGERKSGHVGPPTPNTEVKLMDIPEMNYFASNQPFPRGEICLRGANIFRGYYKEPELTREVLDEDGWFHTGDIGLVDEAGNVSLIDRKKNIFKLSQGEYIAPEKIENILVQHSAVAQAFVYGSSLKSTLVAIIVPDAELFLPWANYASLQDACSSTEINQRLLQELAELGKKRGLNGFESIKAIYLHPELFSVDNDCLTPTFKNKRSVITAKFQAIIDTIFATLD
ncbi:medium-chain fatty acid-CoA ligase faa2 [Entomophthora muscae]|uniref:Medium-chain fatty acid-CoA ligase faa2 n=1 Tax=Entomophthora muscae TaxID=34485 RepID=A0ACC2SS48_9FUNG|nr:medium-chain fatty acid-CoA ligase faa2 [Entomophthora muscae]